MKKTKYISIHNDDNKEWIVPVYNTTVALEIYQPSSLKGKLVKLVLPLAVKIPGVNAVFLSVSKARACELDINEEVKRKIEEMFGGKGLTLSYFSGTPCTHQKSIIQVARGRRVLGYVKYSTNGAVKQAFLKESDFLDYLHHHQVDNVPNSLFCGEYTDNTGVFIQDTKKTMLCRVPHELKEYHIAFLQSLYEKTKVNISYEQSDYYKMIQLLKINMLNVSYLKNNRSVLQKAIGMVEAELRNVKTFCAYHGDFTPWNTFLKGRDLYAFDFEYAKKTYPAYLDIFHFITQTMLFENKAKITQILDSIKSTSIKYLLNESIKDVYISYMQYLLAEIQLFSSRDGEFLNDADKHNMNIWLSLIKCLEETDV